MSEEKKPVGGHFHFSDPVIVPKAKAVKIKTKIDLERMQSSRVLPPTAEFRELFRAAKITTGADKLIAVMIGTKLLRRISPQQARTFAAELIAEAEKAEAFLLKNQADKPA